MDLKAPAEDVEATFESCLGSLGLVFDRMTLTKYPGSAHWHIRQPGEKGTLEATWWPSQRRLWLSVHSNRQAGWQESASQAISNHLERLTRGPSG